MEQVVQQEPLRKSTAKRMMESAMNVVHSHLTHIKKYGVFGEVLFGKTFLEQIREIDGNMKRVADYFVDGGDADGLPMDSLRATREWIHQLIPMVGDKDGAYIAALFRIRKNIDTAIRYAPVSEVKEATEVKDAPVSEVKKKHPGRKVEPLSAIINVDNLGEDEHGNKRTAQDLINRLRELINGCERPTDVSAILVAALKRNYILRFPTESQYKEIGAKEIGDYSVVQKQRKMQSTIELSTRYRIF